jgi:hypothetical protein
MVELPLVLHINSTPNLRPIGNVTLGILIIVMSIYIIVWQWGQTVIYNNKKAKSNG